MRSQRVELILDTLRAQRGARDLTREVDGAAKAFSDTAREGDKAGRAIDDAGDEMSEAARAAAALDRQVDELAGSLRKLAIAQSLGGGDFAKQIREQETQMRRLTRNRKLFADAGDDGAEQFAVSFSQRLGPLLAKLPIAGPMGAALAAAAVATAPLLGAAIAGGIIGGAGIGGVVGGLTLAAKDTRVKAAAKELGDGLERRLYRAGGAFVGPAIAGLAEVQRAMDNIDLEGIFADSADFVQPLAAGVSSAVTDIGGALRELIGNADGPVRAIADGIAQIGRSASTGLKSLADNGEQGAAALKTLFGLISSGTQTTFLLVNALTELYGIGQRIGADMALQAVLKLTGAQMDQNAFSAQRVAGATDKYSNAMIQAGKSAEQLKQEQEQLKNAQTGVTAAQDSLSRSLEILGGKHTRASQTADTLRTAMDNLYGAGIRNTDANEEYQASWDDLSASVKANKATLDINSAAGRSNRDVLQSLLGKNNDLYLANIAAGVSIDKARKKHQDRTAAVKEEARRLGLNEEATKDLINTYGKIPKKKQTDLLIGKLGGVVKALENLYITQRAIAEGIPLASARAAVKEKGGPAKQFGGYATGGLFDGRLPGPPSKVDNLRGHGPDGRSFGLAGGEFIEPAHAVSYYGLDVMEAMRHRRLPREMFDGFATGGYFPPVDTSTRIPFRTDLSKAYVMSLAEAKSRVTPAIPAGGRTSDAIVAAAKALVPGIRVLSKDRPGARTLSGNVSYHSLGRAVDFEPSEKLARLWNANYKARTRELISPYQKYNLHNGQRHTYTGRVWNQHNFAGGNAHDHIAMAGGGVIREPVFGVGRSGTTYSLAERGPERVLSTAQTAAGAGRDGPTKVITMTLAPVIHINGAGQSAAQIAAQVDRQLGAQFNQLMRGITG